MNLKYGIWSQQKSNLQPMQVQRYKTFLKIYKVNLQVLLNQLEQLKSFTKR